MRLAAVPLTLSALFAAVAPASADYSFRTVATSSDTVFLGSCPALNDNGVVAYQVSEFDPETFNSEDKILRRGNGPLAVTVADASDGLDSIPGNPSINERNVVAFDANPTGADREVILRGTPGRLVEIARAGRTQRFDSFTADVSLNNAGRVAFTGELNQPSDEGLFEGTANTVVTRYRANRSPFAGSIAPPSLNDAEQVAFTEERDNGIRGVFRLSPANAVTNIAQDTGELQSFGTRVSLNNAGAVAFTAFDDEFTREALFIGSGGALTEVANTLGPISAFGFGGPSLNDGGAVAFQADLDDGTSGVFVAPPGGAPAPVVQTGDTVAGKTVAFANGCKEMLNGVGQVAVTVTFDDGSQAILRATPVAAR